MTAEGRYLAHYAQCLPCQIGTGLQIGLCPLGAAFVRAWMAADHVAHERGCDETCSGFREGPQEVIADERGTVSVWDSDPCPCPCHDEPG